MSEPVKSLISKAQTIKKRGIALLVIEPILFLVLIIVLPIIISQFQYQPGLTETVVIGVTTFWVIGLLVYSIINLVFSIITIVQISSTDWGNEKLNSEKQTYWILALVFMLTIAFVGLIFWIIWANKVINTLKNNPVETNNATQSISSVSDSTVK